MEKRKTTGGRSDTLRGSEGASIAGVGQAGTTYGNAVPATESGNASASPGSTTTSGTGHEKLSSGIVHTVQRKASEQLTSQKSRATEGLDAIAHAVRQSTGQLRNDHHETVAGYVEKAADQLERLSGALRTRDVGDLLQDAQRLARRRPALFIGGSFALGLLATRFLKSSPDGTSGHMPDESMGRRYEREAY